MKLLSNLKITDLGGGHFGSVAHVSYADEHPDGSTSVREFLLPVDVGMDWKNHKREDTAGSIWKLPLMMMIDMTQTDGLLMSSGSSSYDESSDDESMAQPKVFKNGCLVRILTATMKEVKKKKATTKNVKKKKAKTKLSPCLSRKVKMHVMVLPMKLMLLSPRQKGGQMMMSLSLERPLPSSRRS